MAFVGAGAATNVWRDGDVVRKVLTARGEADREGLERGYLDMMEANIDHPSLPRVRRLIRGCKEGQVAVVMDYVPGRTLWQMSKSTVDDSRRVAWLRAAKDLCDVLWANGIRRADLTSGNVVVQGGRLVLVDYHGCRTEGSRSHNRLLRNYGEVFNEIMRIPAPTQKETS